MTKPLPIWFIPAVFWAGIAYGWLSCRYWPAWKRVMRRSETVK